MSAGIEPCDARVKDGSDNHFTTTSAGKGGMAVSPGLEPGLEESKSSVLSNYTTRPRKGLTAVVAVALDGELEWYESRAKCG